MGNATKIALILVLVLGVGVLAKYLDRNIDTTPSGVQQVTSGSPKMTARLESDTTSRRDSDSADPGSWENPTFEHDPFQDLDRTTADPDLVKPAPGVSGDDSSGPSASSANLNSGVASQDPNAAPNFGPNASGESSSGTANLGSPGVIPVPGGDSSAEVGGGSPEAPERDPNASMINQGTPQETKPANRDPQGSGSRTADPKSSDHRSSDPKKGDNRVAGFPKKHTVADGDRIWDLAREYYQDPTLFALIIQANPHIGDGDGLSIGDVLTIPAPPRKSASSTTVARDEPKPSKPKKSAKRSAPRGFRHYQIQSGDTLYAIARDELGDAERMDEIQRANPGVDPLALSIGDYILIPTK